LGELIVQERDSGKHDALTRVIIRVFYDVYNELGVGFVESVYKECMRLALVQAGLRVDVEVPIPVRFRGTLVGIFKADQIVEGKVILELKVCDALVREHVSQTLNYLRATEMEVALLMNFGPTATLKRLMMDNEKKKGRSVPSV
jgi:GxxExxY protein